MELVVIKVLTSGPHSVIIAIDRDHNKSKMFQYSFLIEQFNLFQNGYQINPDTHIKIQNDFKQDSIQELMCWDEHSDGDVESVSEIVCTSCHLISSKKQKYFEEVRNAASEIMYRYLY